ncbi:hypothetical protein, partial [Neisseria meningitidis]|uniref:hypothetical protein n=1 Tax=Neisseria meningitidis TaxID=487 RepID=UPI001C8F8433
MTDVLDSRLRGNDDISVFDFLFLGNDCAGMTKSNFSASFPRKRESRNSKLQEFIRNNWNSKKLDSH